MRSPDSIPKAAGGRRTRGGRRAAVHGVPEELLWEILIRLHKKEILRCRAVCRTWRRLATPADFLLAHHRLQPSLPLVSFRGEISWPSSTNGEFTDASVQTLDLRRRTPAERRRPVLAFNDYNLLRDFTIHASCDGLLLLSLSTLSHRLFVCNPATASGLCFRISSAAILLPCTHTPPPHRILFWRCEKKNKDVVCYVLTLGSSRKPRRIGLPVVSDSMKPVLCRGILAATRHPSIMLHGCLPWGSSGYFSHSDVVVFDTVLESFIRMIPSPGPSRKPDDYEMGVWSLKYQIRLPMLAMTRITHGKHYYATVVPENGDVVICCWGSSFMFHCDSEGKLLDKFSKYYWTLENCSTADATVASPGNPTRQQLIWVHTSAGIVE
uniref:F-box domain-containing protein n=1 Tax=Leersia perrieri TaxID=77586 RepID=A0A0D9W2K3_9ORYZ